MIFKAVITLKHTTGDTVEVAITGKTAALVAACANSIRFHYTDIGEDAPPMVTSSSRREFYDFLRDFFHCRRAK